MVNPIRRTGLLITVFVAMQRGHRSNQEKGHVRFGILAVDTSNMTYIEPQGPYQV